MRIYKYRDFSNPNDDDFGRLGDSVHRRVVWCARADTLNDPEEFVWECDYKPTPSTPDLLAEVLVRTRGRTHAEARAIALVAIDSGHLEAVAKPVFTDMIKQCRDSVGLTCFGTAADNEILWQRYGGQGAGVCVEFEVPSDALGTQYHRVQYPERKRLRIDELLRAYVDRRSAQVVYDVALLSKPKAWASEQEIRFISQGHSIPVVLDRAHVPRVFMGRELSAGVRARLQQIVDPVPLA